MVFEYLISPINAEKKPWEMLFVGFIYASIAIFLSLWIFENLAGLVAVFFTVLASIPLVYSVTKIEEKKDIYNDTQRFLGRHTRAIAFFIFLFIGIISAFSVWYVFLPPATTSVFFSVQYSTITKINNQVTFQNTTTDMFFKILMNNIRVLIFCVLFSLFYGVGAIFILTWNSSVIAVAIGNLIRDIMSKSMDKIGLMKVAQYFHAFSYGTMRYMLHGLPEMAAYFVGGLAGGIISMAIVRKDFRSDNFEKVIIDASELILLAVAVLVFAAIIEVYVTPRFFNIHF